MKITYGIKDRTIDVTKICMEKLKTNNIIIIPRDDIRRARCLTDPLRNVKKTIFIEINGIISEYNDDIEIQINVTNNRINTINAPVLENELPNIHSKLKINYGSLNYELPEQKMVVNNLKGHEKVLEIGGNIGRTSLVIASMLEDDHNLVILESDIDSSNQLTENRNLNNMNFHIENSALSNIKLIQRGWVTKPSEILEPGFKWINTITLDKLKLKYNINFDTLILDCEGAFYYILRDMPDILNNINLIIMENDYYELHQKEYVDYVLKNNNFNLVYSESLINKWADRYYPNYMDFYEVWKK
jgi:FkbM family methyltransferase